MKKFNFACLSALLFLDACQSSADSSISWSQAGKVKNSQGKQLQLDITGIYDHKDFSNTTFLAGFKIDEEGNNVPEIVRISADLSDIKYWSFESIPNNLFIFQQAIQLVTTKGEVFKLEHDYWHLTGLLFPSDSQAVYSDGNDDLVICYPAALAKSIVQQSGCKSLKYHWQLDLVFQTEFPKVCHGKLYILEQTKTAQTFKQVNLQTGKVISTKPINSAPKDLCEL